MVAWLMIASRVGTCSRAIGGSQRTQWMIIQNLTKESKRWHCDQWLVMIKKRSTSDWIEHPLRHRTIRTGRQNNQDAVWRNTRTAPHDLNLATEERMVSIADACHR
jgi:hypothetical protein